QVANLSERPALPKANASSSESHPDCSAAAFYGPCQGTIVNYLRANCRKSPDAFQRRTAQQDAAACRARRFRLWLLNPLRWIEHQEIIEKGWHQQVFWKRFRLQQNHQRYQVRVL